MIPLSIVIGEKPSIESCLDESGEDGKPSSPHVPNVIESFLKRRPSREEVRHIVESPPNSAARSRIRSRSLSDIVDGPPSIDQWLDDEAPTAHIPNQINRFLGRRPSREDVAGSRIFKSHVQDTADRLARKSLEAALAGAMQRRPSVEVLLQKGILQADLG